VSRAHATPFLAFALVGILMGCAPDNPGRRAEAVSLADRYLQAASGAEPDRGWSLLYRSAREAWRSEEAYVAAFEAADWSDFEFDVLDAIYCDDGLICPVGLELANGLDSVPDVLRSTDNRMTDGLIFTDDDDGVAGNAQLWVINADLFNGEGGVLVGAMFSR
jgi:hypothetical protein